MDKSLNKQIEKQKIIEYKPKGFKPWSQLPLKCNTCSNGRARVKGQCMKCYDRDRARRYAAKLRMTK